MSNIKAIRNRLGLTQTDLAKAFGQSKSNVSHYESGKQELPPVNARKLIDLARQHGCELSFDDIYGSQVGSGNTAINQEVA